MAAELISGDQALKNLIEKALALSDKRKVADYLVDKEQSRENKALEVINIVRTIRFEQSRHPIES